MNLVGTCKLNIIQLNDKLYNINYLFPGPWDARFFPKNVT